MVVFLNFLYIGPKIEALDDIRESNPCIEGQTGQNYLHVFLFARLISATQKTATFAQSLRTALKKPAVYSPHLGKPDSTKERGVQINYLGFGRFGPS
jgi:hypothetical protein